MQLRDVLPIELKPTNLEDKFAVTIKLEGHVVGHLPFNIAPTLSCFPNRSVNKGTVTVEVARERILANIDCMVQRYMHIDILKKH